MKLENGLTIMVCQDCGEHFLVAETNGIINCPGCKVISAKIFTPLDEYLEESREWY